MTDPISRQAAIDAIKRCESADSYDINKGLIMAMNAVADVPTIDPVKNWKLTDKEKRIFLAAMGREKDVCKELDEKYSAKEAYEDPLVWVCWQIIRKVKGALWN